MGTSQVIALPFRQQTDAWLEARLDGIGSSDAPVVARERGSVFALWAVKTRQIDPEPLDPETQQLFDMGHRLEPIIAQVYSERAERPLRRVNRLLRRRDVPWAFASLDRVSARKGERRIVELKTNPWTRWGVGEDVPGDIQAQVQHQLWVTGYDVADVAVLIRGYELRIHEIPRDDGFIADLVYMEREFMRWVETKSRPPVDGSEDTRLALQRVFPREYGEVLPATHDFDELAAQLQAAQREAKAADNQLGTVKNAIRALLGEAKGVAGDGYRLTWTKNKDSIEVNWQAIAKALKSLLLDPGATADLNGLEELLERIAVVESLHTRTKPGSRVLRPWWANQPADEQEEIAA